MFNPAQGSYFYNYQTPYGNLYGPLPSSAYRSSGYSYSVRRKWRKGTWKSRKAVKRALRGNFSRPRNVKRIPRPPQKKAEEVRRITVRLGDDNESFSCKTFKSGETFAELQMGCYNQTAAAAGVVATIGTASPTQGDASDQRSGDYIWIESMRGKIEMSYKLRANNTGSGAFGAQAECNVRLIVIAFRDDSSGKSQNTLDLDDFFESASLAHPQNLTTATLKRKEDKPTGDRLQFTVLRDELIRFDPDASTPTEVDTYGWSFNYRLGTVMYDVPGNNACHFGPGTRIIYGFFTDLADPQKGPFWRGHQQMNFKNIS